MIGNWWAHYVGGREHQAWCRVCPTLISAWTQTWGDERLPSAQSRKIAEHRALHLEVA